MAVCGGSGEGVCTSVPGMEVVVAVGIAALPESVPVALL